MLEDLIQDYINAMHKANIKDMLRIERAINGLGMDSMTLRTVVKELEAERKQNGENP